MTKMVPFEHKGSLTRTGSFSNILDGFFDDGWFNFSDPELETFKLDIKENENQYTIVAELPGVKKKEITLDLVDGRLTIGVAEKEIAQEDKKKFIHRERRYSYMQRSIYLADADNQNAEAKLEHGELIITVPKVKDANKKQQIEIQ